MLPGLLWIGIPFLQAKVAGQRRRFSANLRLKTAGINSV
jgi:hypothetical protein